MRVLVFFLLTIAITMQAHAADRSRGEAPVGAVPITGVGLTSCGDYVKYRRSVPVGDQRMDVFANWADGYISAYNMRSNFREPRVELPYVSNVPLGESMLLYIEKHCTEHPLDTVMDATIALVNELGGHVNWKHYQTSR